jgi:hypothetical protein
MTLGDGAGQAVERVVTRAGQLGAIVAAALAAVIVGYVVLKGIRRRLALSQGRVQVRGCRDRHKGPSRPFPSPGVPWTFDPLVVTSMIAPFHTDVRMAAGRYTNKETFHRRRPGSPSRMRALPARLHPKTFSPGQWAG